MPRWRSSQSQAGCPSTARRTSKARISSSSAALEYARSSKGGAPTEPPFSRGQQLLDIAGCLATAGKGSPLQKCAHTLTMGDAGSLRVLEQLVEEPQLGDKLCLV